VHSDLGIGRKHTAGVLEVRPGQRISPARQANGSGDGDGSGGSGDGGNSGGGDGDGWGDGSSEPAQHACASLHVQ